MVESDGAGEDLKIHGDNDGPWDNAGIML